MAATCQPAAQPRSPVTGAPRLLTALFTPEKVRQAILPRAAWRPFPRASDRAAWEALPAATRARAVERAATRLDMSWPELKATTFLEFRRNGNRSRFEGPHFERRTALAQLVLGECVEGKGRFLDDIVNGVWAICEESFWGVSAHNARHSPRFPVSGLPDTSFHEVDLFAAETAALLAWTHYLVGDEVARELPVVPDRIVREVEARVLRPYREVDTWNWLGKVRRPVNNWNPWIHSNILTADLLLEDDPQTRLATVERCLEWLDVFLEGYHRDGGCDEGPGYWGRAGASLFDCLELLYSASGENLDAYGNELVKEIGRFIYRVHIDGPWYVNFADASAHASPSGNLVYRYGQRIGDPKMTAQGAFIAQSSLSPEDDRGRTSLGRALPALFTMEEVRRADGRAPLVRDAWLDGIQVLTAREAEGSAHGLYLAAKGGHNAESHNHNDVGNFIVALDGYPVLIDVGVETYTRFTFSDARYTIWTMQSLYHNLPAIDGQGQAPGRDFAARNVNGTIAGDTAGLEMDITGAYPAALGVRRWARAVRLERGRDPARVVIEDSWELAQAPRSLALHLMASGAVDASTPGRLRCATPTRPLALTYDASALSASVEELPVNDARLEPVWGNRVYRIVLAARQPRATGTWTVTAQAQ